MIPELNVSSIIAIFALFGFILMNYPQRNNFFTEYSIDGFLSLYTKVLSLLLSLLLYSLFRMIPEADQLEAAVFAGMIGIATGLIIETSELGKHNRTIPDFLEEVIVLDEKYWMVGIMMIILSLPFIGIFAIQSDFKLGVAWFYGTLAGTYCVHWAIKFLRQAIDSVIDWLTCIFDTEG